MTTRDDRRSETEEEFARYKLPINTEKVSFFSGITPKEPLNFPNTGTRGCFMSHLTILDAAKRTGKILILEDDIQFSNQITRYGEEAAKSLDDLDWGIAYLGHQLDSSDKEPHWEAVNKPMLLAHCYAVNGKVIDRLTHFLKNMLDKPSGHPQGGPMHYDGALNTFLAQNTDIKAYYYSKNLGYQRPSKTDIHQSSIIDRNPLLKLFSKMYRTIKRAYLRLTR
jgi:glycosyl transferase family 25